VATETEGFWPSTKSRVNVKREPLPDTFEVKVNTNTMNLCLFWRRRDEDALGILASRAQLKRPVTVAHALAAASLLREIGEAGALRLATRLERLCVTTPLVVTWRHDELPARVRRRETTKALQCTYKVEPHTGLKCKNPGAYLVDGTKGSFCELHARRTALRVERRKKKDAAGPTPMA
jgi:hypothetical protein